MPENDEETEESPTNETDVDGVSLSEMRTHRDEYDWTDYKVDDIPPYYEQNNEMSKALADIDMRQTTGKLPRFLIGGPTGAGKTQLAKAVAYHLDVPFFEIQCKYSMNELDLLGSPRLVGGESFWSDGPLVKALMASASPEDTEGESWTGYDGPVVLLLDEVNRARPEAKGVLFSALDSRAEVAIEPRGGEVISGNAQDLIVFATVNEGPEYIVEQMDKAEVRRFNTRFDLNYLGETRPDSEIRLLTERTPIASGVAMAMVGVANHVRNMASADEDGEVRHGIPTSMLLSWARTACAYAEHDFDNPVMQAAQDTVLSPFYNDNTVAETEVSEIIESSLYDAPVSENEDYYEWLGNTSDTSTPFGSVNDIKSQLNADELKNAGFPASVIDPITQDGGVYLKTLQDANLSDRTIMVLCRDTV